MAHKLIRQSVFSKFLDFLKKLKYEIWSRKPSRYKGFNFKKSDLHNLLWINPDLIVYVGIGWGFYVKNKQFGKIVAGDWDMNRIPFHEFDVYKSFYQRLIEKSEWENTSYYKDHIYQLKRGKSFNRTNVVSEIIPRLEYMENLFDKIRVEGYGTQTYIKGQNERLSNMDEITCRISRFGEYLFEDGRHRLAIAKLLNLEKIAIRITWRHQEWYQFRKIFNDFIKKNPDIKIPKLFHHADINAFNYSDDENDFLVIKANIGFKPKTMLNPGAGFGFFCHKFEDEGVACYAVESQKEIFYFMNQFRIIHQKKFASISADLFEFHEKSDFELILALNILHTYLKTESLYNNLILYLNRVNTHMIFFENGIYLSEEKYFKKFDDDIFIDFILKHTGLRNYSIAGKSSRNKNIYKIY